MAATRYTAPLEMVAGPGAAEPAAMGLGADEFGGCPATAGFGRGRWRPSRHKEVHPEMRLVSMIMALVLALAVCVPQAGSAEWNAFKFLKLIVDDRLDPEGEVFVGGTRFLAIPGGSELAYLLNMEDYTVRSLAAAEIPMADGAPALNVQHVDSVTALGLFDKEGPTLKWAHDGHRFALAPKPPLLGIVTVEEILKQKTAYGEKVESYQPVPEVLAELNKVKRDTEIVAAFGTWCPVCQEWLPDLIKVQQQVTNERIRVTYLSCGEEVKEPADLLKHYAITDVPSFVVREGDQEIGRIGSEDLEASPEPVLERLILDIIKRPR